MSFELSAYLRRIGLPAPVPRDAAGLAALHRAHRLAIAFENLDIRLGRGIAITGPAVFAKLVTARRGGYCFEHDRLFADALAALGFTVRPLLARVWLGVDAPMPHTHTFSLVTLDDGTRWIADAGFGGGHAPPMPLVAGAAVTSPDGTVHELEEDAEHGWMLWRSGDPRLTDGRAGGGRQRQYSFTPAVVHPGDLAMGNHWTSTAPGTRFVDHVVVSRVLPDGFATLTGRQYRHVSSGVEEAATIADAEEYRRRLERTFGIALTAGEVGRLGLF